MRAGSVRYRCSARKIGLTLAEEESSIAKRRWGLAAAAASTAKSGTAMPSSQSCTPPVALYTSIARSFHQRTKAESHAALLLRERPLARVFAVAERRQRGGGDAARSAAPALLSRSNHTLSSARGVRSRPALGPAAQHSVSARGGSVASAHGTHARGLKRVDVLPLMEPLATRPWHSRYSREDGEVCCYSGRPT